MKSVVHGRCPACRAFSVQVGPRWVPTLQGEDVLHETYTCKACGSTRVATALNHHGASSERHVIDRRRRTSWSTLGEP